jgi:hypothetical protein
LQQLYAILKASLSKPTAIFELYSRLSDPGQLAN